MKSYEIEKNCYYCETDFMVISDCEDVEYCPFCGEKLEEYDEDEGDDEDLPLPPTRY